MQVYQTDREGFYVGPSLADPDPLDVGSWLIPGGCVTVEPPATGDRQRAQWVDGGWTIVTEPEPDPLPEPQPPTKAEQEAARAEAYRAESDPIYFAAQRGEATMDEWLVKIAEIKARHPYPAE